MVSSSSGHVQTHVTKIILTRENQSILKIHTAISKDPGSPEEMRGFRSPG